MADIKDLLQVLWDGADVLRGEVFCYRKRHKNYSERWFVPFEDVKYEAHHFKNGEMSNENTFKIKADYATYKGAVEKPLPKFKFNTAMIRDFKENLMPEIAPLM